MQVPVTLSGIAELPDVPTGTLAENIRAAFVARRVHRYQDEPATISEQIHYEIAEHLGTSPVGFDGAHAQLRSQITDGRDVLLIETAQANTAYLDARHLRLLNVALLGNGAEGNGITVRAWQNGSAIYKARISTPTIEGVGGDGVSLQGWMFENDVTDVQLEACKGFGLSLLRDAPANTKSYHTQTSVRGGIIRTCGKGGIFVQMQTRGLQVFDIRFISNKGPGIVAENGIDAVENCIFENNGGSGAVVANYGYFRRCFFSSSLGAQPVAITVSYLVGDLVLDSCEYGSGTATLVHVAGANATGRVIIRGRNAATAVVTGVLPAARVVRTI